MRRAIFVLPALVIAVGAGCWQKPKESATEREFRRLRQTYVDRFNERMIPSAESEKIQPVQITAEAARIWQSVFEGHEDVVRARQKELLDSLEEAPPIDRDLHLTVAEDSPSEGEDEAVAKGAIVLKQFTWSPAGAANHFLTNWLARRMNRPSYALRSVLSANAALSWEVQDPNPDAPVLVQRQGPMVFIVELTRKTDYYVAKKLEWLKPKTMGPVAPPSPPPEAGPGTPGPAAPPTPPAPPPPTVPETGDIVPKG